MSNIISRAPARVPMLLAAAIAVITLAGCGSDPVTPAAQTGALTRSVQAQLDADLKAARQATARFSSFEQAKKEGYTYLFANMCMVDGSTPSAGGMGFHYVNTDLLGPDNPTIDKPQAVLYEPASNGSLKLVALEYVVPADLWAGPNPPHLFGQDFTLNGFNLWALHVWLYKANPSGMFEPWNPDVSCQYAQ